tara:strand:+ start:3080 stop:3898 length:819 start_codon:yes stop_codon:yes gene_type:complete
MAASTTQIKTSAMKKFISTYGGMVPVGGEPDDPLIAIFDDFGSAEDMFAWLAERWIAGGFDKAGAGTKATKTTKAKKDPNKPKWCNAYMHFTMDQRSTVKEENPDMSNTEVTKELGRMWREDMSTEDKEPYVQAAADDKRRYDLEMQSYNPSETPPASTPKKATPKKATKAGAKKTTPKEETKKETKKAAAKKSPPKEEKKTATKKATPKKKETPKKKSELEEAYVRFVETESEAIAQEREDGEEEPYTAEEMEEYLVGLWEDLSEEDRLEY